MPGTLGTAWHGMAGRGGAGQGRAGKSTAGQGTMRLHEALPCKALEGFAGPFKAL